MTVKRVEHDLARPYSRAGQTRRTTPFPTTWRLRYPYVLSPLSSRVASIFHHGCYDNRPRNGDRESAGTESERSYECKLTCYSHPGVEGMAGVGLLM